MAIDRPSAPNEDVSPDPVRSAFQTAVTVLEAGRASLLLRHHSEPVLVVTASIGIASSLLPSIRVSIGQGVAGLVAERGLALFGERGDQTFISVPVVTERGVEGVLNLTDRRGGTQYSADDLPTTRSFAAHIAHLLAYSRSVTRDPVSGLPNRRAFEGALEAEIARSKRTGSTFAVVFIDLDNLKSINDTHGHATGDAVIRGVGDVLHGLLRPYDFAGRYGGDEFALLLSGASEADGGIVQRVADAVAGIGRHLHVTVASSVGVARYPLDGTTSTDLISTADARMYEHKRRKGTLLP